jgi:hypothetical protein
MRKLFLFNFKKQSRAWARITAQASKFLFSKMEGKKNFVTEVLPKSGLVYSEK